jgi:hypothetical protein
VLEEGEILWCSRLERLDRPAIGLGSTVAFGCGEADINVAFQGTSPLPSIDGEKPHRVEEGKLPFRVKCSRQNTNFLRNPPISKAVPYMRR